MHTMTPQYVTPAFCRTASLPCHPESAKDLVESQRSVAPRPAPGGIAHGADRGATSRATPRDPSSTQDDNGGTQDDNGRTQRSQTSRVALHRRDAMRRCPHRVRHTSRELQDREVRRTLLSRSGRGAQRARGTPHGRRGRMRYLFSAPRLLRCSFLPCSV